MQVMTTVTLEINPTPTKNKAAFYTKLPLSGSALALASLCLQEKTPLLVIVSTPKEAILLQEACHFFAPELDCQVLPSWETLPYDHFSPEQSLICERLLLLHRLPHLTTSIVITTPPVLTQRLAPVAFLAGNIFSLKKGQTFRWDQTRRQLDIAGYHAVDQVTQPGEYAVRGSLFDIFPMGENVPFRIDLFDDEIEAIKRFNPETQRSENTIDHIELLPAHEFPMNEEGIKRFRENFREKFSVKPSSCPIYEAISRAQTPAGIEYYLPLFFEETNTLFDYLPQNTCLVVEENLHGLLEQEWQHIKKRFEQLSHDITRPILSPTDVFVPIEPIQMALKTFARLEWTDKKIHSQAKTLPFKALPDISIDPKAKEPLEKLKQFVLNHSEASLLFCAETEGRKENFHALLKPLFPEIHPIASWENFCKATRGEMISVALLEDGFECHLTEKNIILIPEAAIFGLQTIQTRRKKTRHFETELVIRNLAELNLHDPIVHIDHGVGRYEGMEMLEVGGQRGEFLKIQYDGGELYVPVSHLHLISRYSGHDKEHAPLHRLGAEQWEKAKEKANKQIRDVAAELLELYAARAAREGFRCRAPDAHYQAFVAAFPFEETPDQRTTAEAIVQDMTSAKPMDRLICGDVGFGKTEIAMRAAFLAVNSGKQVAILVPTTLLAQQHYDSFSDRFAAWPIKIDMLSRFRSAQEQKNILENFSQGKIDILIGTHKLLQQKTALQNIGLLILDEEHRFGVQQKEQLKKIRANIDVLAMTATPIPRTLNMAMHAIRDLSIIATPPAKRLPIKTFVHEFDWALVREAIQREILRGGQVYFLHNDVSKIERFSEEVQALIPEARVAVAHGQMHAHALEKIMDDFYHQRFNVLVCSTIIETGIDVPHANTILIDRADKFGLSQLHQLRGRVGRSHHQAYAYLFTPPQSLLTADAEKRLEAISTFEELGAGFILATHDLEIRGAGELLGEEQSGNIQSIGYSLYTELLDKTIKAMQRGELPKDLDSLINTDTACQIELQIPAFIPSEYIHDTNQRLILYKRIASANTAEELNEVRAEMIDRFGPLADQTQQLFNQMSLKWHAQKLGIKRIEASGTHGRIEFIDQAPVDPTRVIHLIQKFPTQFKLDKKQGLKFFWVGEVSAEKRIQEIEKILSLLD